MTMQYYDTPRHRQQSTSTLLPKNEKNNNSKNREVIETLVFESPHHAFYSSRRDPLDLLNSKNKCCSSKKNKNNNATSIVAAGGPSLEKPRRIRVVSFQDQQELSMKLNSVMKTTSHDEKEDENTNENENELCAIGSNSLDKKKGQHTTTSTTTSKGAKMRRHQIVDLDEAFERYPPIPPSLFTSSWDSSDSALSNRTCTNIIAEHDNDDNDDNDSCLEELGSNLIPSSSFSSADWCRGQHHRQQQEIAVIPEPSEDWMMQQHANVMGRGSNCKLSNNNTMSYSRENKKKSIQRDDVLRIRQWGQRLWIPSHLLKPPLIRRQRSSE